MRLYRPWLVSMVERDALVNPGHRQLAADATEFDLMLVLVEGAEQRRFLGLASVALDADVLLSHQDELVQARQRAVAGKLVCRRGRSPRRIWTGPR